MCFNILSLPGFDPKFVTSTVVPAKAGEADDAKSNVDALHRQSTALRHLRANSAAREMIKHIG
jgi:hypothetical protein